MEYERNILTFSEMFQGHLGRRIIYTNARKVTKTNIADELSKALVIHRQNKNETDYLNRYYKGDQPINYRRKITRPEVNNKIVVNLAYELVERKTAEICAEPIQYVLRGTEERKSEEITQLNSIMDSENKQECDIEICRWRSICGTAYRFIGNDESKDGLLLDESDFTLSAEDPRYAFVVYYPNNIPAFSCQIRNGEDNEEIYHCFTKTNYFVIINNEIVDEGPNGNGGIPVIEYPNNSRRLSDIEITIGITDAINTLSSDRINGIEQFVSSWVKFVNCEIDSEQFEKMRNMGAMIVRSYKDDPHEAVVDVMTQELNQSEGQIVFNDLFDKFLDIQGLASRQSNTGGDTQGAVQLRNGHYDSGLRTAINEPILKKSENMSLRIILNRLHITRGFTIMPSDIDIHINHNKLDNILVKSQALEILLRSGIHYSAAIKVIDLFSDPEFVTLISAPRMQALYPDTLEDENENNNENADKGKESESGMYEKYAFLSGEEFSLLRDIKDRMQEVLSVET